MLKKFTPSQQLKYQILSIYIDFYWKLLVDTAYLPGEIFINWWFIDLGITAVKVKHCWLPINSERLSQYSNPYHPVHSN